MEHLRVLLFKPNPMRLDIDQTVTYLQCEYNDTAKKVVADIIIALSQLPTNDDIHLAIQDYEEVQCVLNHGCYTWEYAEAHGIHT